MSERRQPETGNNGRAYEDYLDAAWVAAQAAEREAHDPQARLQEGPHEAPDEPGNRGSNYEAPGAGKWAEPDDNPFADDNDAHEGHLL